MSNATRDEQYVAALLIEDATLGSPQPALRDTTTDGLWVHIVGNDVGAAGGTSSADDADFVAGTTAGTPAMGVYQTSVDNVTDGDLGTFRITQKRALYTSLESPAGDSLVDDTNDAVKISIVNDDVGIGGGTQYDTNVAYQDGDSGTLALTIRDDALSTLTEADGDYSGLRVTSVGRLWTSAALDTALPAGTNNIGDVDVLSSALPTGAATAANQSTIIGHVDGIEGLLTTIDSDTGGILTAVQLIDDAIYVDDADWTDGTSKHVLVGGLYQSSPQTVTDGDVAPFNITINGALHVAQQGNVTVDLSATDNGVLDNIDSDLTTIIGHVDGIETLIGTSNTSLNSIDQNTNGIETLLTAISAYVDGIETIEADFATETKQDTIIGHVDGIEGLLTTIDSDTGGILTAAQLIDDVIFTDDNAFTPGTSKVAAIGFIADSTSTDKVDEGDVGIPRMTLDRRVITQPYADPADSLDGTASATTDSDTEVLAAQGAGVRIYVTSIVIYNASSTDTGVEIKSGSTTRMIVPAPATSDSGGGAVVPLPQPLRLGDNEALNFASMTGVTTMYVSAVGYKATV